MRSRCGNYLPRPGFSFVEVVIATLVLGILLAVAAPRWLRTVGGHRVAAAGRQVAGDLRWAAAHADAKSQAVVVQFFPTLEEYRIVGAGNPDRPGHEYRVSLKRLHGANIVTANFGELPSVMFNGFGVPHASGTVTLQVGSHQVTVTVDAGGKVSGP